MHSGGKDIWEEALDALRPRIDAQTFEVWLAPVQMREMREGVLHLVAPNRFLKEWFEANYLSFVLEALEQQHRRAFRAVVEVGPESDTPTPVLPVLAREPAPRTEGPAPAPAPRLHPRYRFERFITGASNELAASAAQAVAEEPGSRYNPLFLYGSAGLGKTHLLQAIGAEIHARQPNLRIVYVSAEQFMNEFVSAVRHKRFDSFRNHYRQHSDCLLVDDIQFIAGRERTMEEFFHVFNCLHEAGKQIVIAADRPPDAMEGMEERLISRLNWGLVADIQPPDLETRLAILGQRADLDGLRMPAEALLKIAERVPSNVRKLEGTLLRIRALSDLRGRAVDLELVQEVLGPENLSDERAPSIEAIQKIVAGRFGVRVGDLKGPRRLRRISRPRMVAMYLSRELTQASFPEIGIRFGGKDHSTVINACRKVDSLCREDPELHATVQAIRQTLVQGYQ